jgi:2-phospho-L-lactate/phosphoenolpyruvate guanylyltransferase
VRTAAILPIKRFAAAKQRLGATVADPLRAELARAMVGDVLSALARTPGIERTIVVTNEPLAAARARELGALVLRDEPQAGQSAAVELGVRRALGEGFERVLCVPGDCPAMDPEELAALLDPTGEEAAGVTIVPDRHGTGTNGLLLCPPDAIAPSFGPGSCERHRMLAASAGVAWRIERPGSLTLDIDTGADLSALRERLSAEHRGVERPPASASPPAPASAPRTRELLAVGALRAPTAA